MEEPYSTKIDNLKDLKKFCGKDLGISEWFEMSQHKVNLFAELTHDKQWIHIDERKATKYSPYKKTVAHGYLVLSYASKVISQTLQLKDIALAFNYGLNKVRFPNATPSNSKFRGRVSLNDIEYIEGGAKFFLKIIFEVEGEKKPVCVAETISLVYEFNA